MEAIEIESLVKNESGHFTSNYVCVIAIDDGRFFIDYHYSENPTQYGTGRLFSHTNINGVNYENGRYIKEGKCRLSLVALYDCESKEDAIRKFNIVFETYKQKYGDLVLSNKKTAIFQKAPKCELRIPISKRIPIVGRSAFMLDCEAKEVQSEDKWHFLTKCMFPIEIQYGTESFKGVPTRNVLLEATKNLGYRKFTIKIEKPEGFRPRFKKEFGTQILFDSSFKYLSWVVNVTIRTSYKNNPIDADYFSFCSDSLKYEYEYGQYHETNELSHYRIQSYFWIFPLSASYSTDNNRFHLYRLYSILNTKNVFLHLGNVRCYLPQEQIEYIKKNLIVYCALNEVLNMHEKEKDSWLTSKGFCSESNSRFLRRSNVLLLSIDRNAKEAIFIGHSGNHYITTLNFCTCKDFQNHNKKRNKLKSDIIPCKHMFRLATELGYFKGLNRLPIDRSTSPFLSSLNHYNKNDYSEGFSIENCEPWKMPFIVFRPMVQWMDLRTGKTGCIELFLGFRNIIFDPTPDIDFDESYYLKCGIKGEYERLEDIYLDVQDTGHYRVTQIPTDNIYIHLLNETPFDLEVYIYGEDLPTYIFSFPKTKGFSSLFQSHYQWFLEGRERQDK